MPTGWMTRPAPSRMGRPADLVLLDARSARVQRRDARRHPGAADDGRWPRRVGGSRAGRASSRPVKGRLTDRVPVCTVRVMRSTRTPCGAPARTAAGWRGARPDVCCREHRVVPLRHGRASATRCAGGSRPSSTMPRHDEPVPGISAAVATPDGAWTGVAGKARFDPAVRSPRRHTVRHRSVTKTFVAAVILQLREEGKLSLSDQLSRWETQVPNATRITVRQLLSHTSGVRDMWRHPSYKAAGRGSARPCVDLRARSGP